MRMAFEFKEEFDRSGKFPLSATINIDRSIFLESTGNAAPPTQPKTTSAARGIDRDVAWSDRSSASTRLRQASPATCRASVARYGQSREKRRVRGEPAGYELGEEPHALRLACLALCEKPERSVHVQVGARRPHQQGVGISDKARQCRHPEPLPYCNDLRLAVRGPERTPPPPVRTSPSWAQSGIP